jgi:RNA polymerase sigma factor (sigma-70 family)
LNQTLNIPSTAVHSIHIDILSKCKQGDRFAQMQVYNLYYKAMYNTSVRIVKNAFEAEDLMQESFLKAFAELSHLQDLGTFSAWLKRIVVNKSINSLKHQSTYQGFIDGLELTVESEPYDLPYSVSEIKTAIEQLSDGYRLVLSLYLLEGYDHEEIGEILGISSSTSRSQYNRGRNKLKQLLIHQN